MGSGSWIQPETEKTQPMPLEEVRRLQLEVAKKEVEELRKRFPLVLFNDPYIPESQDHPATLNEVNLNTKR